MIKISFSLADRYFIDAGIFPELDETSDSLPSLPNPGGVSHYSGSQKD
jgi:hypothetical protein